jgi:hypothetical protein
MTQQLRAREVIMRALWRCLLLSCVFPLTMHTAAAQPAAIPDVDLYKAQTIVTGTGEAERLRGFRVGAAEVLTKLTGNASLAATPKGKAFIETAVGAVSAIEYEDRMKDIPVHDEQGTRDRPHYLRIWFDRSKLDGALRSHGLKKWEGRRPLIAVLLGIGETQRKYVLLRQGPQGYGQREVLKEAAQRSGVPLILPDAGGPTLAYDAVAKGDAGAMEKAARALGADAVLYGTLDFDGDAHWNTRWTLTGGKAEARWSAKGQTFDEALRGAIARAAHAYAEAK